MRCFSCLDELFYETVGRMTIVAGYAGGLSQMAVNFNYKLRSRTMVKVVDILGHDSCKEPGFLNYPAIEILDTSKGFKPLAWIYSLRNITYSHMANSPDLFIRAIC